MNEISYSNIKRGCTILMDTFCATGCEYCLMSSREKNKAEYGFDNILPFLKTFHPHGITIFGGDTFYDTVQIKDVVNSIVTLPTLKSIKSVSELSKLKRDFDIRTWVYQICMEHEIRCGVEFSIDLEDKKSGDFHQILSDFCKITQIPVIQLTTVITSEQIMSGKLPKLYQQLVDTYSKCEHGIFFARILLDHNSVHKKTYGIEEKINEFFDSVTYTRNMIPNIFSKNYCRMTDGENVYINQKGEVVLCGHTGYKHDMKPISLLNKPIDYHDIRSEIFDFKSKINLGVCNSCEAQKLCSNCIKVQDTTIIDGTQDICMYYKNLYKRSIKEQ